MKQLSGIDNLFLQLERGNNHMHVAGLGIYDPSTAPGGSVRFKDILRFFSRRIEHAPLFRRRLVQVPFALDRPYWIEDAGIDVEFHVRHIALPQPGDWRQLCIQVARIHSRPLDRSKPLWEAYVIEGLHNVPGVPPGSFALYVKLHHALIDGESGTQLTQAIHALSADDVEEEGLDTGTTGRAEAEPSSVELYSRALVNSVHNVPALARFSLGTAARLAQLGAGYVAKLRTEAALDVPALSALKSGDLTSMLPKMPPETRFSGPVSAHRVFEAVGVPFDEMKAIRRQIGDVTINDLFMAIVGGALNRYLGGKGELPGQSILAMVPMTLRGEDKSEEGNRVGFTLMPVHSELGDPVARLLAIHDDSNRAKQVTGAVGKDLAPELLQVLPSLVSQTLLRSVKLPRISLIVSNVRGPETPLYMAGARLVHYSPISIPVDGVGLNVTGFSYAGTMWICAVSCRDMLPDPAHFADCLRESFRELGEAAIRHAGHRAEELAHAHEETAEPMHLDRLIDATSGDGEGAPDVADRPAARTRKRKAPSRSKAAAATSPAKTAAKPRARSRRRKTA